MRGCSGRAWNAWRLAATGGADGRAACAGCRRRCASRSLVVRQHDLIAKQLRTVATGQAPQEGGAESVDDLAGLLRGSRRPRCPRRPDRNRWDLIRFLDQLEREIPTVEGQRIVPVSNNLCTGGIGEVLKWLCRASTVELRFTPTYASWLNQIKIFFSILYRRLLKHGIFRQQGRPRPAAARADRDLKPKTKLPSRSSGSIPAKCWRRNPNNREALPG